MRANASSTGFHRRTAYAHHQHAGIFPDRFVVDINAHHRIRAQRFGLLAQLLKRNLARFTQLFLVRAGASADDIPNAGKKSRKMLAPRIASPVTTPQYSVIG